VFGLLGLTLAFTFAGAADRFAIRRDQIVQEANTIGTAYLRLDLLPTEDQPAIRALFRQYLETRIEVYDKFADRAASSAALNKGNQLQREIWTRCVAATQKAPRPEPGLLLLQALNEMIDMTTTRTMAALIHAPIVVTGLLVVLSLFGALLAGYAMSAQPRRNLLHQILFGLAITCTIYVVLDLEYPRIGLINLTSIDRVIVDLREMMK
jgi:ABC-type glycerol-3-phosphate transport system permease component